MLLERGSLCRTTGSTLMNAHSSRSHAIFTVLLEQRIRPEGEAPVADEKVIRIFQVLILDKRYISYDNQNDDSGERVLLVLWFLCAHVVPWVWCLCARPSNLWWCGPGLCMSFVRTTGADASSATDGTTSCTNP